MSDEDDQSQYHQIMENQRVLNESVSHEMHLWLETLDAEGLDKVGTLLHAAMSFPMWGAQMLGILQAMRKYKFNICVVCGADHDKEKEAVIAAEHAKMAAEGTPIPGTPFHVGDAAAFDEHISGLIGTSYKDFLRKCSDYNVRPMGDQEDAVYCKGCNMRYINLADRMLKAIDDCSGCHVWQSTGTKHPEPPKK